MRIHHRRRGGQYKKPEGPVYRVNEQITAPEIRVIDDEGQMAGVMSPAKALELAQERGFDLVEVFPKAEPPVCKLLDFGQFKYQKEKEVRLQKAHAKKVDTKGIRLSVKMGAHDLDIRKRQAEGFLEDGHKIKIEIRLRGREREHGELANERIQELLDHVSQRFTLHIEQPITRTQNNVSCIVGRKT